MIKIEPFFLRMRLINREKKKIYEVISLQRITLSLCLMIVMLVSIGCTAEPLPKEKEMGSIEVTSL
ncbi:MAG: hypothetical protein Q7I94_05095 [Candidatus Contubernalis sp.]|nr:hypothetical protein [Candidatus Contubernalis sp.]